MRAAGVGWIASIATATVRDAAAAAAATARIVFVAVMCAAYYATNNAANNNDDGDDDRSDPPLRAIPRHIRDSGSRTVRTVLHLPFLVGDGHDEGAVAIRKWPLVGRRAGRLSIITFV